MSITIPDHLLRDANMSEQELRTEIAVIFFQRGAFTLGKASEYAGLHPYEFQKILAERKISLHYDYKDLLEDLDTLKSLDA